MLFSGSPGLSRWPTSGKPAASVSSLPTDARQQSDYKLISRQVQPQQTFAAKVEEVRIAFSVLDRQGRAVARISPGDVEVTDERHAIAELSSFVQTADLPLRLGVLVDISESMTRGFADEQKAAHEFLEKIVRPDRDKVLVGSFATHVVLSKYGEHTPEILNVASASRPDNQTALYDALTASCLSGVMTERENFPVRRAIVLLSDGEDTDSYHTLQDAIRWAQRFEVAVYAIRMAGSPSTRRGNSVLEELASATGGRVFFLSDDSQLATAFGQIEEELRLQYVLTYQRSLAPPYDGFHHVQVAIRDQPNLRIISRAGYFARGSESHADAGRIGYEKP